MLFKINGGVSHSGWFVAVTTGGVAPIGWISPATVLIDEALNDYDVVWAAAGHPHAVFPTTYDELIQWTGARPMPIGDVY